MLSTVEDIQCHFKTRKIPPHDGQQAACCCCVTQLLTTFPVTVQAALAKQKSQYPGVAQNHLDNQGDVYPKNECLHQHLQKSMQPNFFDIESHWDFDKDFGKALLQVGHYNHPI